MGMWHRSDTFPIGEARVPVPFLTATVISASPATTPFYLSALFTSH